MCFCLICWRYKLQTVTAQPTHEAELITVALASNELIWIRKFMIKVGFAIGACTPIARPMITSTDSDLPEIDNVTDFAPEVAKEDADGALYSDPDSLEPPYLFNDNKGTTVNNPVTNSNTKQVATKSFVHGSTLPNVYSEVATTENPRVRKSGVMDGGMRSSVLGGELW